MMTAAGLDAAAFSSPRHKRSAQTAKQNATRRTSAPMPATACAAQPSGMVGWWRGEGDAIDAAGNNPGSLRNGATFSNGYVGQGFSLDGLDDYVDIGDVAQLQNAGAITVMAWIKPNNTVPSIAGIVGKWSTSSGTNNTFLLNLGPNSAAQNGAFFVQFSDGSNAWVTGQTAIPTNQWTHITGTWRNSDGALTIYKNGVADGTITVGAGKVLNYLTNYTAKIGEFGSNSFYFPGLIDEPIILGRALSGSEIEAIFNAGSSGVCHSCAPAPTGMVSMWGGENNPLDSLGRNNAELRNSATYAPGIKGQAFSFDGVDDYIEIPDSVSLGLTGGLTLEAWVKQRSAGFGTIFSKADDNGSAPITSYGLQINPAGAINVALYGTYPEDNWTTGPGVVTVGQWNHIALTWDGTYGPPDNVKLYVNGSFIQSWAKSGTPLNVTTQTLTIGSMKPPTYYGHLDGLIDEPAIFSRALSGTEITAIYNAGSAGFCSTCAPAPVGLVSWWAGDENGLDRRNTNNGALVNGSGYANGLVGQAFVFDGADDSFVVPDNPSLDVTSAFTLAAWVNPSAPQGFHQGGIISKVGGPGGNNGYQLVITGLDTVYCQFNAPGESWPTNQLIVPLAQPLTAGEWTHIACTYDHADLKVIVNGNVKGSINVGPKTVADSSSTLRVSDDDNGNVRFLGSIDEPMIFDRALSTSELQHIVNAGSSGVCKPTATTPPAGVVGWWGGDGFNSDISGNANHGTLTNGAGFAVGKVGQAFSFDGVDDYVNVPDASSLNPTTQLTIESWVYPVSDSAGLADFSIILNKELGPTVQYELGRKNNTGCTSGGSMSTGNLGFYLGGVAGLPTDCNGWVNGNAYMPLNTWSHVVVTYDGAVARVYLNGGETRAINSTGGISTSNGELRIGTRTDDVTNNPSWKGLIDELAIYNRAITQAEIQAIVNAGLAGKLNQVATLAPVTMRKVRKTSAPNDTGVYALAGDATIYFPAVNLSGMTHEIPLDPVVLPRLPLRTVGLTYDIATSAQYTGPLTVCFNLPSFTTTEFATLHILHLENGGWVDVTYASSAYPSLCAVGLTSLSPFAIVTTAPTAAELSIAGRVVTAEGRGIRGAFVTVTGTGGDVRTVATGNLGRYVVDGLNAGETYIVTVRSRRFTFAQPTRLITLNDNVADADFIGLSGTSREQ